MDTAQGTPEARTRVKLPPDPYGDDEPRPSRGRRPLILLGALIALVVAITIVNRSTHHSSSSADSQAGGQPSAPAGAGTDSGSTDAGAAPTTAPIQGSGLPANTAGTIPVGYPHSSKGAESAAANYVVAYESSSMATPTARHELINDIADPAIASSLQSELDSDFSQIDASFGLSSTGVPPVGQTFVYRAAPVGVSLSNYDGGSATVSVWVVTLLGLAGNGSTHPVTESWSTLNLTLHWTQGDWKWVSFSLSDGPVPTSGQQVTSSGQQLQNAVNQFGGLRYAR